MHYVHDSKESLVSRFIKFGLRMAGLKRKIEKDIARGSFNQDPAKVPSSILKRIEIETDVVAGRTVWTVRRKQSQTLPRIMFLHGGAYIYNMGKEHWAFINSLLAQCDVEIVIPDYPLAPAHSALEAHAFLNSVYAWLGDGKGVNVLMGDSAGAGLALSYLQSQVANQERLPQHAILIAPWLDIALNNPACAVLEEKEVMLTVKGLRQAGDAYRKTLKVNDFRVSPGLGECKGLPSISLFIGGHDLFYADTLAFKEKLTSAGGFVRLFEYPSMMHDWPVIVDLPEAKSAIIQIAEIVSSIGHKR
jgi:acetyl esterase/lipase